MIQLLTENNGTKYGGPFSLEWILPRCEFLLKRVKDFEPKLIEWYKKNKYSQGDDYYVSISKKGKWQVGYTNDYPMQHGSGEIYTLTEEDFIEATKK